MTSTDVETVAADGASLRTGLVALGPLALGGMASLGAGAIHAVAVGSHSEHPQAARAFLVVAVAQVVWGALALAGRHRMLAASGLVIGAAAVAAWVTAKTVGIGFIDGLEEVEPLQRADVLAAALAAVGAAVALRVLVTGRRAGAPKLGMLGVATVAAMLAALVGMDATSGHLHDGGADHGQVAGAHHAAAATSHSGADHGRGASEAASPYDPTKPIDLGGVAGVTLDQQARAENLVAITLARLPQFADYRVAEAAGYHSIRDGFTGHEHFINWAYVGDDQVLNPDVPESLVYERGPSGSRKLVSAMFMLPPGKTLDDVPDIGGALTQWHIHDDLCFSNDPVAPRVAGITSVGGRCRPPTTKLEPVPMIHVWITKHRCGPFSALEGVGAGQVAEGETKACDHAHGA